MAHTFLNAEAFATSIAEDLSARCNCTFTTQTYVKNKTTLVGIMSRPDGDSGIAPILYVNDLFTDYNNGNHTYEEIVEQVRMKYESALESTPVSFDIVEKIKDWDQVKAFILPAIYGKTENDEFISQIVCTPIDDTDLVVGYNLDLDLDSANGVGTIKVLPKFLEYWNCSLEELHEVAVANQRANGYTLSNMESIVAAMMSGSSPFETAPVLHLPEMPSVSYDDDQPAMFTLTTANAHRGASLLADPQIVEMLSNSFGKDLVIIPSSVHELIIIPNAVERADEIRQMVYEVNRTQVAPDEVLSDNVYGICDGIISVL